MANNDRLEELLEASIKAQQRTTYAVAGVLIFLVGSTFTAGFGYLAFLVDSAYVRDGFWYFIWSSLTFVSAVATLTWPTSLAIVSLRGIRSAAADESFGYAPSKVAYAAEGQGYAVAPANLNVKSSTPPFRSEALFATPGRTATGADLNIAKYFSADEYSAWQLSGRPNLEEWVDAGRPELLKWLEENSEN